MEIQQDHAPNLGEQLDELLYRWDEVRRRPVVVVGGILTALALLGLAWFATQRSSGADAPPVDDRIPTVSLAPAIPPSTAPASILVHVAGAVRSPGVYELASGARVLDAIEMAGGAASEGQPDRLNLAAPVIDGMQIRVPVEGESAVMAGPDQSGADGAGGPVNLNTATAVQLESLPGVGPATAAAIVAYRQESGGFGSVSDLLNVRGIGEAKLAGIEDLVVVQ